MKERRCGRPNSSAALKQTTSGTRILNRTEVLPPVTRQYEQSNRLGVLGLDYEPLFTSTSTFFPRPPHACIRSFFRCFFPSAKTCHRGHINHYYNALRKTPLNAGKIIIVPKSARTSPLLLPRTGLPLPWSDWECYTELWKGYHWFNFLVWEFC